MSISQRLDQIRAHLSAMPEIGDEIVAESIVIRDEHYVGRQFRTHSHRAIWFIEPDELKIYEIDGGHWCTLDRTALDQPPAVMTVSMDVASAEKIDGDDGRVDDTGPATLPMFRRSESDDEEIRKAA